MPPPQHNPLIHKKRLLHNLTFKRVGEYFGTTHALTPLSLVPTSFETTLVLSILHPQSNDFLPLLLEDFESN
jgi:hypothetical protein